MRGRHRIRQIMSAVMCAVLLVQVTYTPVMAEDTGNVAAAVQWLKEQLNIMDSNTQAGLINDACDAMAVLRESGQNAECSYIDAWIQLHSELNTDELCHLARAYNDIRYLLTAMQGQNTDGSFGLTPEYTGTPYDTMLVLEAAAYHKALLGEEEKKLTERMAQYMETVQNEDGGFGHSRSGTSGCMVTVRAGLALLELGYNNANLYNKIDRYCMERYTGKFDRENFAGQSACAGYMIHRGLLDREELQKQLGACIGKDGSVYGSIHDTAAYIMLLKECGKNTGKPIESTPASGDDVAQPQINDITVKPDRYVLETGNMQKLSFRISLTYRSEADIDITVDSIMLEDGTQVGGRKTGYNLPVTDTDREVMLEQELECVPSEGHTYKVYTVITAKEDNKTEKILKEQYTEYSLYTPVKKDIVLSAVSEGQYVSLSWNDISGDDRYTYRVLRREAGKEWSTCSVWGGDEKVNVLNIYPCKEAENVLKNWMEKPADENMQPAGMGLFNIETISIDEYNRSPYDCLTDENGNYKYDVLMFGTYDTNAGRDLTQQSYEETRKFAESGRGILFGHDTVTANMQVNHPVFAQFEDVLGIRLIYDGNVNPCKTVKVVKTGLLTGYPWKLEGELAIPYAHSLGQYTGGTNKAAVWMEFCKGYLTDSETGGNNNAYLFSNNQYAMIQTGHSNGAATGDERKVLANTLFYLKQVTGKTQMTDKSVKDSALPVITGVSSDGTHVYIEAEDTGTEYEYRIQAAGTADEALISNTVRQSVTSGIRGYITIINNTVENDSKLIKRDSAGKLLNEIVKSDNGNLELDISRADKKTDRYLHIYAVDMEGNISNGYVYELESVNSSTGDTGKKEIPYVLAATDGVIELNCSEGRIDGDIYAEEAFRFQGSVLDVNGTVASAGNISAAGWKINIKEKKEKAEKIRFTDYTAYILKDMGNNSAERIEAYNSTSITVPTLCKSTTGAWCNDIRIEEKLVSEGNINLNSNTVTIDGGQGTVLCSQNGGITIQATRLNGGGLIYAPEGTVTINVSELNYNGSIIAKEIKLQMGYCNIGQESD